MMRRRGSGGPPLGGETVLMGSAEDDMEYASYGYRRNGHGKHERYNATISYFRRTILTGPKLIVMVVLLLSGMVYCLILLVPSGPSANYAVMLEGISDFLDDAPAAYNDEYVVFVSVSNGLPGETYIASSRSKHSAEHALQQAQRRLPKHTTSHPWIKIDVVTGIKRIEEFNYYDVIDSPGPWYGIALDWDNEWVFLPDEVLAHALVDHDGLLRWERILSYARSKALEGWPVPSWSDDETIMQTPLDLFRTESVSYNTASDSTPLPVSIVHGHDIFDSESITPALLREATRKAVAYLVNTMDGDGRIIDQYLPRSHRTVSEGPMLRHASGMYAMARAYRIDPENTKLRTGLKRALHYLLDTIKPCPAPYEPTTVAKCVVEEVEGGEDFDGYQESWTGTNSETVMAIAEYMDATGDWSPFDTVKDIAYWITHALKMDDWFLQWVQVPDLDVDEDHYNRYAHSRTIYALARLYNLVNDKARYIPEKE